MIDLKSLNESQLSAVIWSEGPLLVLAGPGSGKTKVLTTRIANLIEKSPNQHFRILALTFTNKAATEMRERLEMICPQSGNRVLLTTFHSFAADVLRQHGSHVGLKPDFSILTQETDRERVLSDALAEVKKDGIDFSGQNIKLIQVIDKLLSDCVPDDDVVKRISNPKLGNDVRALFIAYKKCLLSHNRVDYGTLIYFTIQLLKEKERIAKQLRTVYTHICVDEFQDTNFAQYTILKLICGSTFQNLFVVADDDQIIYQWNGASPERLQALKNDYKMQVIQLPANYRCPPKVIEIANNLISHNLERSPGKKPLQAIKTINLDDAVSLKSFEDFDGELSWIATELKSKNVKNRGEYVVLARTTKVLEAVASCLNQNGVPAHTIVRRNEFESDPMQWLHSTLRLTNTRTDQDQVRKMSISFFKLLKIEVRPEDVIAESALKNTDLLRTWFDYLLRQNLEEKDKSFLSLSKKLIVDRMDFATFINECFKWFDGFSEDQDEYFVDYKDERDLWKQLQQAALRKYGSEDLTLNILLQEIDLAPKTIEGPQNSIPCMTIHGAKGMEFKHVYLVGLAEDNLPSFQSIKAGDQSREMQEERRNCFVAITRTEETLTLTFAKKYFGWAKKSSRFLTEMGLLSKS